MNELKNLAWVDHTALLSNFLQNLVSTKNFCDVTICCNGKYFPVHRIIISAYSEYFKEILEQTPCRHPFIVLRDVQSEVFKSLLDFMYYGSVDVLEKNLPDLIAAASHLKIKGLLNGNDIVDLSSNLNRGCEDTGTLSNAGDAHSIQLKTFAQMHVQKSHPNSVSSREIIHKKEINIGASLPVDQANQHYIGTEDGNKPMLYNEEIDMYGDAIDTVQNDGTFFIQNTESVSNRENIDQSDDSYYEPPADEVRGPTQINNMHGKNSSAEPVMNGIANAVLGSNKPHSTVKTSVRKKRKRNKSVVDVAHKKTLRKTCDKTQEEIDERVKTPRKLNSDRMGKDSPMVKSISLFNADGTAKEDLRVVIERRKAARVDLEKKQSSETIEEIENGPAQQNTLDNPESDLVEETWAETEEEEKRQVSLALALSEGRIDQESVKMLLKDTDAEPQDKVEMPCFDDIEPQPQVPDADDNDRPSSSSQLPSNRMVQIPKESLNLAQISVPSGSCKIISLPDIKIEDEFMDACGSLEGSGAPPTGFFEPSTSEWEPLPKFANKNDVTRSNEDVSAKSAQNESGEENKNILTFVDISNIKMEPLSPISYEETPAIEVETKRTSLKRNYHCRKCDYVVNIKHLLLRHKSEMHPVLKTNPKSYFFRCKFCSFHARKKKILVEHLKLHDKMKKPETAEPKSFTFYLKKHDGKSPGGSHIKPVGEKPFYCPTCEYRTSHKKRLEKHITKKHSCAVKGKLVGAKPYECLVCDYRSAYKKLLEKHSTKHISDVTPVANSTVLTNDRKRYHCHICSFRSVYKGNLNKHLAKLHDVPKTAKVPSTNNLNSGKKFAGHSKPSFKSKPTFNSKPLQKIKILPQGLAGQSFKSKILPQGLAGQPFKSKILPQVLAGCRRRKKDAQQVKRKLEKCDYCSYQTYSWLRMVIHLKVHMGEPLDAGLKSKANDSGVKDSVDIGKERKGSKQNSGKSPRVSDPKSLTKSPTKSPTESPMESPMKERNSSFLEDEDRGSEDFVGFGEEDH